MLLMLLLLLSDTTFTDQHPIRTYPKALPSDWSRVEAKRKSEVDTGRRQVGHLNLPPLLPTLRRKLMHLQSLKRRKKNTPPQNKAARRRGQA